MSNICAFYMQNKSYTEDFKFTLLMTKYILQSLSLVLGFFMIIQWNLVITRSYATMKITLLYQVSHYIRVQKQRNIKSWVQQNYLVIRGFCYIRLLYNEVPLY